MTYTERSQNLANESSVAVLVLMGAPDDVEFVPLRPRPADENTLAQLKARWPGRGLRSVGVIGLCGVSPRYVLKETLETEQVYTLTGAFLEYLHVLYADRFAAQQEAAEFAELECLYTLPDTRPN